MPKPFKNRSILVITGIFFSSITDIFGIASILPLLISILSENSIKDTFFLGTVYNFFSFDSRNNFILFLSIIVLLFIILKNIFGLWVYRMQVKFTWNIHELLSKNILYKVYEEGYLYFSNNNSNQILNNVYAVPIQFSAQLLRSQFQFITESIILSLLVGAVLIYDYNILFLLILIILPINLVFYRLVKVRISFYGKRLNELQPLISKPVFEVIFGYFDVRINQIFSKFEQRFTKRVQESKSIRINLLTLQNIPQRLIEVGVLGSVILFLLYATFYVQESEKIVAMLSVLGLVAYRCIPSVNRILLSIVEIRNFNFTIKIIERFLKAESKPSIDESISFTNKICIKNVGFTYPEAPNPSIKDLDLEISKGESIGIVGKSGSGKTTLMNILIGFLKHDEGQILIDEKELNNNTVNSWHKKCGYVRQDVFIIDGSVAENIAFGVSEEDTDDIKLNDVIKRAQLEEFINDLEYGIKTNIGERGAKISGGQRQRIGIARALYHGAEVLFFDEATSALDNKTEMDVTEAIRQLHLQNLTMVIIAHRESTLKYCDRIISLDDINKL